MKQLKYILLMFLSLLNTHKITNKISKNDNLGDNKALKVVMIAGGVPVIGYVSHKVHKHFSKKTDEKNTEKDITVEKTTQSDAKKLDAQLPPLENKETNPSSPKTIMTIVITPKEITEYEKEITQILAHLKKYDMTNIQGEIIDFLRNYDSYADTIDEQKTKALKEKLQIYCQVSSLLGIYVNSSKPSKDNEIFYPIKGQASKPLLNNFHLFLETVNQNFTNHLNKNDLDKINRFFNGLSKDLNLENELIILYNQFLDKHTNSEKIEKPIMFYWLIRLLNAELAVK
jgi:hypothetical protein